MLFREFAAPSHCIVPIDPLHGSFRTRTRKSTRVVPHDVLPLRLGHRSVRDFKTARQCHVVENFVVVATGFVVAGLPVAKVPGTMKINFMPKVAAKSGAWLGAGGAW